MQSSHHCRKDHGADRTDGKERGDQGVAIHQKAFSPVAPSGASSTNKNFPQLTHRYVEYSRVPNLLTLIGVIESTCRQIRIRRSFELSDGPSQGSGVVLDV